MKRYPIFSARNLPAYVMMMALWMLATLLFAWLLRGGADPIDWPTALGFAGVAVMSGMAIMFGASVVNLRKLRPGFEALARGEKDPAIPPVWCPVLTMATRAAVELSHTVGTGQPARPESEIEPGKEDRS
jgi:hypothetical protein